MDSHDARRVEVASLGHPGSRGLKRGSTASYGDDDAVTEYTVEAVVPSEEPSASASASEAGNANSGVGQSAPSGSASAAKDIVKRNKGKFVVKVGGDFVFDSNDHLGKGRTTGLICVVLKKKLSLHRMPNFGDRTMNQMEPPLADAKSLVACNRFGWYTKAHTDTDDKKQNTIRNFTDFMSNIPEGYVLCAGTCDTIVSHELSKKVPSSFHGQFESFTGLTGAQFKSKYPFGYRLGWSFIGIKGGAKSESYLIANPSTKDMEAYVAATIPSPETLKNLEQFVFEVSDRLQISNVVFLGCNYSLFSCFQISKSLTFFLKIFSRLPEAGLIDPYSVARAAELTLLQLDIPADAVTERQEVGEDDLVREVVKGFEEFQADMPDNADVAFGKVGSKKGLVVSENITRKLPEGVDATKIDFVLETGNREYCLPATHENSIGAADANHRNSSTISTGTNFLSSVKYAGKATTCDRCNKQNHHGVSQLYKLRAYPRIEEQASSSSQLPRDSRRLFPAIFYMGRECALRTLGKQPRSRSNQNQNQAGDIDMELPVELESTPMSTFDADEFEDEIDFGDDVQEKNI